MDRGEKGDGGGCRDWHGECPGVVGWGRSEGLTGDVGHIKAGHEIGGGQRGGADVGLDLGFAVEVINIRKNTFGH